MNQQIREQMNHDPATVLRRIEQYLEQRNNIQLNVAITGETGSGKTSFVNVFRGIENSDQRAAPVGCKETTKEVNSYPHPNYPNVTLWDLPGIGTRSWTRDTYEKEIGFERFDFFIIISDTHRRENDVQLATMIREKGKRFYFVHSKIDQTLRNESRNDRNFTAETTLALTSEKCIQGLQEQGFMQPQVFLVSNFEPEQHDFPRLHETFNRELDDLKKHALLCTTATMHRELINRKKKDYQAGIMYYGAVSALGAAVPIPGLSVALDIGMVVKAVKEYVTGFGLDPSSVSRLAFTTGVPYDELCFSIQSVLAQREITGDLILKLLTQLGSTSVLLATEEWTRFIPILGIPIAAGLSFTATHRALNFFLDELANEAHKVYKRALALKYLDGQENVI